MDFKAMTAAEFYSQHSPGWVCAIGGVRVRVTGSCLAGGRIVLSDRHGRSFWLNFDDRVALIDGEPEA